MDHRKLAVRPRVHVLTAWRDGWSRVFGAPVLVAGMVAAMALASEWQWTLHGASTWGPGAIVGAKLSWVVLNEPTSFGGIAVEALRRPASRAVLFGDATARINPFQFAGPPVAAVVWIFLVGGAVDRLARDRRLGSAGFFSASGVAVGRFLRLGMVLGAADWIVFKWLSPFRGAWDGRLPNGVTPAEALGWAAVLIVAFVGDYARVRLVVEDRRSALGALAAAARFITRRPARSVLLLLLGLVTIAVPLALCTWVLPLALRAAWATTLWLWCSMTVLVTGRLGLMAGEVAFFQGELAHAGYTARPAPRWPDSPAVEAITNLQVESRPSSNTALPL